jgi:Ca-activated chloride channel family protein
VIRLNDFAQLEWRNLWWLLLALQPLVLVVLAKFKRAQVLEYADPHLRAWAIVGSAPQRAQRWARVLTMLAWLALACAAAGPRLPLVTAAPGDTAVQSHDIDIMLVLDVSASMQATDLSPQRLQRAKLEITNILQRLHGEQIGLIAFAGTAGLLAPFTHDYAAFAHYLDLAEPGLFALPGSNLAAALQLARAQFASRAEKSQSVLLVTDGETEALSGARGVAASQAVAELKKQGVTLYVLVAASRAGAALAVAEVSAPVQSRPDEYALRQLAESTGGRMAFVSDGDADGQELYEQGMLTLPGAAPAASDVHAWRELYPYCLVVALLLFVLPLEVGRWLTHAPRVLVMLGVAVLVAGGYANTAQAADPADAYAAYRDKNYSLAQLLYHEQRGYDARLGEGAAAYRRQRYAEAIEQFTAALLNARDNTQRADALFNLGNSYFQAKNYPAAVDAYRGTLELRVDDPNASVNLARASALLQKTSTPGPQAEGIPGRRSQRFLGSALEESNNDAPVDFDTTRERMGPDASRDAATSDGARATTNTATATEPAPRYSSGDAERDYRAALKKLELINDQPAAMLKELIKLDTPLDAPPSEKLPPW